MNKIAFLIVIILEIIVGTMNVIIGILNKDVTTILLGISFYMLAFLINIIQLLQK